MKNQGFTNEELITILQSLKTEGNSDFNQSMVKADVYNKITSYDLASKKPVLLSFNKYINIFKPVMAMIVVGILGYSGFVIAANISPLSPLYVVREKADKLTLSILPENKKIEKKFDIASDKLAAIKQTDASPKQITKISESVKKDLNQLTTDIKNIKDPKKLIALSETLGIKTEALQKESNPNLAVTTGPTLPSDIKDTIKQTADEILAVIYNAQSKSDNCPKYVAEKMAIFNADPDMNLFIQSKYSEVVSLLKDAKTKLENDDCLGALASLDTVESYKLNIVIQSTDSKPSSK
jgi:hypothetical protein